MVYKSEYDCKTIKLTLLFVASIIALGITLSIPLLTSYSA